MSNAQPKKLYRSTSNKQLAGVCGGFGEYFEIDPTAVRLIWIILTIMSGLIPGMLAYFIAALVMPVDPSQDT
jgi:phage shock protein C